MRYYVLACDYDGTLAHHGHVGESTLAALERLLATGRKLVLVTGRQLDELVSIFPELELFACVVAENGALLYNPATKEEKLLSQAPQPQFMQALRDRGVAPLASGRVIVAGWKPNETVILETIRDQGLDLQVIFNKEAVMVLPAGVNKATGLSIALAELGFSPHEAVAVGDAENDLAFLGNCECGVAVANALPAVKKRADLVTTGDHGRGVEELIDQLVANDLMEVEARLHRHYLLLGSTPEGVEIKLPSFGYNLLIAGPSGSGKSTAATSFLERLSEQHYQFCIIDPEGDYENLAGAVTLGGSKRAPTADEVLQLLANSHENAVVNLVGLRLTDRPSFFLALLPRLQEMRARCGRPHWLIVDEAHHLLPASWQPGAVMLPREFSRMLFITVHPDQVMPDVMKTIDKLVAVGPSPEETVTQFCTAVGSKPPKLEAVVTEGGEVFLWSVKEQTGTKVRLMPSRTDRRRHTRKYAEGELTPEQSFYFTGPDRKLNLRAQNLILFMQLADGIDDDTWLYHLRRGDYSTWLAAKIKDETLAGEVAKIEKQTKLSPVESRAAVRAAIEHHYTLPAAQPLPMPGTSAAPKRE